MAGRLVIDPVNSIRKTAEFRERYDTGWSGLGFKPLEVQWGEVTSRADTKASKLG